MKDLTRSLINDRLKFLGYGNLDSEKWFIGMEEGYQKKDSLLKRFENSNKKKIIDIYEEMGGVKEHLNFFLEENKKIQKTWEKLILISLHLENKTINKKNKLEYQKKEFGRKDSKNLLIEFMPLPEKSTKEWSYSQYKKYFSFLENRKEYVKEIAPKRQKQIRELILKHNPKRVIFYGKTYLPFWKEIIKKDLKKTKNLQYTKKEKTIYYIIPHPVAWKINWEDLLKEIKRIE